MTRPVLGRPGIVHVVRGSLLSQAARAAFTFLIALSIACPRLCSSAVPWYPLWICGSTFLCKTLPSTISRSDSFYYSAGNHTASYIRLSANGLRIFRSQQGSKQHLHPRACCTRAGLYCNDPSTTHSESRPLARRALRAVSKAVRPKHLCGTQSGAHHLFAFLSNTILFDSIWGLTLRDKNRPARKSNLGSVACIGYEGPRKWRFRIQMKSAVFDKSFTEESRELVATK